MRQYAREAIAPVQIFSRSLLCAWEPLSSRSSWDFRKMDQTEFTYPILPIQNKIIAQCICWLLFWFIYYIWYLVFKTRFKSSILTWNYLTWKSGSKIANAAQCWEANSTFTHHQLHIHNWYLYFRICLFMCLCVCVFVFRYLHLRIFITRIGMGWIWWYLIFSIFIGPMCTWGPIIGSPCLSVSDSEVKVEVNWIQQMQDVEHRWNKFLSSVDISLAFCEDWAPPCSLLRIRSEIPPVKSQTLPGVRFFWYQTQCK